MLANTKSPKTHHRRPKRAQSNVTDKPRFSSNKNKHQTNNMKETKLCGMTERYSEVEKVAWS